MSHRIFNFSAGPAMLPTEVLEKSAQALLDYQGKGFGIAEVSHRGKEFDGVTDEAILRCKPLLGIGDTHDVLFMQGGATQLFTLIPMNLLHGSADYLVGGEWSKKAASFGKEVGQGQRRRDQRVDQLRPLAAAGRVEAERRRRLLPRLHQRDRARPPPADVAEAPEPRRRRQQRVHVPPAPGQECAMVYGGARRTSARRASCSPSSARTSTRSRRRRRASCGASRTWPRASR